MDKCRYGKEELARLVSEKVIPLVGPDVVMALEGPLGAGKTTLVKELLCQMGLSSHVVSPTFSYVNEYELPSGLTVHHFDLYRISSLDEFYSLGFDDILNISGHFVIIEWPGIIDDYLIALGSVKKVYKLVLDYSDEDLECREISIVRYR